MRPFVLSILLFAAACGAPEPPVVATDVEVTRPMPGMHMSAGFLVITNNSSETIEISGVTSPQFESVEIHETTIEDGISRMRELDFVTLHLMSDDALVLTVDYSFPMDKD
jgi:copper(I)-binding protein